MKRLLSFRMRYVSTRRIRNIIACLDTRSPRTQSATGVAHEGTGVLDGVTGQKSIF